MNGPTADRGASPEGGEGADRAERGTGPAGRGASGEPADKPATPAFGDAWVYESIVGALPGASLSKPAAIGLQLAVFEVAVLLDRKSVV